MTPFLFAAPSGQQDIVAYLVKLWGGAWNAFHRSGFTTKNVFQCTRGAGGKYEVGVAWLSANCKGPEGQLLHETEGPASRSLEQKTSGKMAKHLRIATRLESQVWNWKTAGRQEWQGQTTGSTGGWKGGSKGGPKGDEHWSGKGQWQGWTSCQGWNCTSH